MKIFHCADTHLGYRAYSRHVPEGEPDAGLNLREADVYAAWDRLIAAAIATKPDVVIHAGDLFDRVRPSNRAIDRALEGLHRLSQAGLPTIIVAGNHETPRLRETGHVFRLLRRIPGIHPLFAGKPEQIAVGDLLVTGVAHSGQLAERVGEARSDPDAKLNLLVTHGAVSGIKEFRNSELNQAALPDATLQGGWDYVALGHYHEFTALGHNTWYCGSNERFSFSEEKEPKGYAMVELPGPQVEHYEITCRQFVTLSYDCQDKAGTAGAGSSLTERLLTQLEATAPDDKVIRQRVWNISREEWSTVDRRALLQAARGSINYALNPEFSDTTVELQAAPELGTLLEEFRDYLAGQPLQKPAERDWLLQQASELLGGKS